MGKFNIYQSRKLYVLIN